MWNTSGSYFINATYGNTNAIGSFDFEVIDKEPMSAISSPNSLDVSTDNSAYVLGLPVKINFELNGVGSGESILVEILDPKNKPVLLQSLFTNSTGMADIVYQLESTQDNGIYSIIASSSDWNFKNSATFTAIAQIPDMDIGDVTSTNQNGTTVNSFEIGDMGYFQTPIISNSVSDVLITVNIFYAENIPLSKVLQMATFNKTHCRWNFRLV